MSDVIFLSNVRLSFPHLVEPQRQPNPAGGERISYNCEFILPQDHPSFVQFMKKYGELALGKWKDNATAVMGIIQNDRKLRCFGSGADKINKKTFQPYDSYVGNMYITAGRDSQPQMIQADGSAVASGDTLAYQTLARKLYAGCRVNAAVKPWLQENKHGRGVRCDLVAIQFAKDDTPFGEGSGTDTSNLFKPVESPVPGFASVNQATMPSAPFQDNGLPAFLSK